MTCSHHARQNGFTLVELLVSLTLGSVLLTLGLSLVHRTMRVDSAAKANAEVERVAGRLSQALRYDVHRASELQLPDNSAPDRSNQQASLKLTLQSGQVITYQRTELGLLREEQLDPQRTRHEQFPLPDDHIASFSELDEPPRLVFTIECLTHSPDTPPLEAPRQLKLRVEAVVGLLNPKGGSR